jgi:hypothetical protein
MDLNRLGTGEKIAGASAIALLLIMFIFKWFGLEVSETVGGTVVSGDASENAWGSFSIIDLILFVGVVAALGLVYVRASGESVDLPLAAIVAALGILSAVLILFRIISPPDLGFDDLPDAVDNTRKIGAYLGLIAAAGVAYGGYRAMQESGGSFSGAADQIGDRFGGETERGPSEPPSAPPPPPPPPGGTGTP